MVFSRVFCGGIAFIDVIKPGYTEHMGYHTFFALHYLLFGLCRVFRFWEVLNNFLESLHGRFSLFRVPVNVGESQEMAHPNLVKNIGDHFVAGMETYKFLVSYRCFAVFFVIEVGVAKLQVGKDRIFAVGIVFLEFLKVVCRLLIFFFLDRAMPERASCSAVLSTVGAFFEKTSPK